MSERKNKPLKNRTVLVSSSQTEFAQLVQNAGAHVLRCPEMEIRSTDYATLDDAIDNLYGYDWLIFINVDSVGFFLKRLAARGRETSELDSIKVCAIGESPAHLLEESHVHVDLFSRELNAVAVVESLANYLGGRDKLAGLNFMIPQAAIGRDYLKLSLEDAGARADVVDIYRTTAAGDSSLLRLRTLLTSGGVDCVIFFSSAEIHRFAKLFDTNDLSRLLAGVAVVCVNTETKRTAIDFNSHVDVMSEESSIIALDRIITSYFHIKS